MAFSVPFKTKVGDLKKVVIKGEGVDKRGSRVYTASLICKPDSEVYKDVEKQLKDAWEEYKKVEPAAKGAFTINTEVYEYTKAKTASVVPENVKDPEGKIDPETEEVMWIPTGNMRVTAYTSTTWANSDEPKVVKVFDGKGNNLTAKYAEASYSIGNGSRGIIHGTIVGVAPESKARLVLYLDAVQLATLVKYEGRTIDTEEIEGAEEIDMDMGTDGTVEEADI